MSRKCRVASLKNWVVVFTPSQCCFNVCVSLVSQMRNAINIILIAHMLQRMQCYRDELGTPLGRSLIGDSSVHTQRKTKPPPVNITVRRKRAAWLSVSHYACILPNVIIIMFAMGLVATVRGRDVPNMTVVITGHGFESKYITHMLNWLGLKCWFSWLMRPGYLGQAHRTTMPNNCVS